MVITVSPSSSSKVPIGSVRKYGEGKVSMMRYEVQQIPRAGKGGGGV